jgi:hypothetical protein
MDQYGGEKKTKKTKKTTKPNTKKPAAKKTTKTTKTRSKAKGGNFLEYIGDLAAQSGSKKKMKGGDCQKREIGNIAHITIGPHGSGSLSNYYNINKKLKNYSNELSKKFPYWSNNDGKSNIVIACNANNKFYFKVNLTCNDEVFTYEHLPKDASNNSLYFYYKIKDAEIIAKNQEFQISLVKLALLSNKKCEISN